MTQPRHHIGDETLAAYAAGNLDRALSVVVASHLTLCPSCRSRLEQVEEIGGLLLDELEPMKVSSDGLDLIMARLDEEPAPEKTAPNPETRRRKDAKVVPQPLRDLLPENLDDLPWRNLGNGVKQYRIEGFDDRSGTLCLLNIAPGTMIPQHTHQGAELTLILKGSFGDELGRFQRGDIAEVDSSVSHQPIADTDEPCICLIATEGPLRFKGILPRLLQPIIGM